jgi:hypothetical protein
VRDVREKLALVAVSTFEPGRHIVERASEFDQAPILALSSPCETLSAASMARSTGPRTARVTMLAVIRATAITNKSTPPGYQRELECHARARPGVIEHSYEPAAKRCLHLELEVPPRTRRTAEDRSTSSHHDDAIVGEHRLRGGEAILAGTRLDLRRECPCPLQRLRLVTRALVRALNLPE